MYRYPGKRPQTVRGGKGYCTIGDGDDDDDDDGDGDGDGDDDVFFPKVGINNLE